MYEPWVILTSAEQSIKNKIEKYGTPLSEWSDIKINYGIKTGLNEAFIIDEATRNLIIKNCYNDEEKRRTDQLIRPILRGKDIKQGRYDWDHIYLICLVPSKKYDIDKFPAVKQWLIEASWDNTIPKGCGKYKLEQCGKTRTINGVNIKSRKSTTNKWFETQDSIAYMDDFNKLKIFYSETNSSEEIKISLIPEQFYADKTCFVLSGQNIEKIFAVLSNKIFLWYMKKTSPLLGEKGISLTKETVSTFPLPKDLDISNYHLSPEDIEIINQ